MKDLYIEFCKKEPVPLFSQYWWLDAVCGRENWEVLLFEKGGEIFGSFAYFKKRKAIFNGVAQPKLTQCLGPYIKYPKGQGYYKKLSWEKEIMDYFIDNLPKYDFFDISFHHSITNWLPFFWRGFKQSTKYTYLIEKDVDIDKIEINNRKRRRKKAQKLSVEVAESDDIENFYRLNQLTHIRQKKDMVYDLNFIKNLYTQLKKEGVVNMFFATYQGKTVAANFLVEDKESVYYLMGGIDPEFADIGAMDLVQYESIKYALSKGKNFDFEGSMVESIEKYFRSFGATQKAYFEVTKTDSKLLKAIECVKDF